MKCPKCGSENVNVQIVEKHSLSKKGKGLVWWLFIGWWWWIIDLMLWFFLTIPRLFVQILKPSKYKMKSKTVSVCVCQNCGHNWNS